MFDIYEIERKSIFLLEYKVHQEILKKSKNKETISVLQLAKKFDLSLEYVRSICESLRRDGRIKYKDIFI